MIDYSDRCEMLDPLRQTEYVFDLAAVHGERDFIDTSPDHVLMNMAINENVFTAATRR